MIKKSAIAFFLLLLIMNSYPLFAELESSIEMRSAVFFHSSERFREIYSNVGASYQLEASTKVYDDFDGWVNLDWFSKHGNSKGYHNRTKVSIANISLGIKYSYQFYEKFSAYIGLGSSFSQIRLKNKSHCGHETVSKWAVGGVLKTGIYHFINETVFIDFFVDYLYQPVHFEKQVDIGGFKIGAGLGIKL